MTQMQYPAQPSMQPARPTSAIVFGILNIIFGIMGLIGSLMMIAVFVLPLDSAIVKALRENPVYDVMLEPGAYRTYSMVSACIGLPVTLALIAAGAGLFLVKPWARKLSIAYGVYGIVSVLAAFFMNLIVLNPLLEEKMAEMPPGPERAGVEMGMMTGTVFTLFGLIYPICLLIFMFRRNVVEAFDPNAQITPPSPPVEPPVGQLNHQPYQPPNPESYPPSDQPPMT